MPPVLPSRAPIELRAAAPELPPPVPAAAPRPALGRRAALLVGALLLSVGVAVFFLSRPPSSPPAPRPAIEEAFHEVDLGVFSRPFATDAAGLLKEEFVVRVVLVLNPKYGDPAKVRPLVERRRNLLRHVVNLDVIYARPEADLRRANVLEDLSGDILRRLNGKLGSRNEEPPIQMVLFPDAVTRR
jgi:hypothetical protein